MRIRCFLVVETGETVYGAGCFCKECGTRSEVFGGEKQPWFELCPVCSKPVSGDSFVWLSEEPVYEIAPGNEAPEGNPGPWRKGEIPVGGMWLDTPRYFINCCPVDGKVLVVIVPMNADGTGRCHWAVDHIPNNSDKPWERSGEPPWVTVRPSILIGASGYHGWLTSGWLEDA